MQRAGAREQDVVGLDDLRVRHAAIDRADGRAGLLVVEPHALGALLGDDVEDLIVERGVHRAVGAEPLHAGLVDGRVRTLRLAGAAVDALVGDHRGHWNDPPNKKEFQRA